MLMKAIRWPIGQLILLLNFIFSPRSPKRSIEQQAAIDAKTKALSLYQLPSCPFCVKVRRTIKREGLNIDLRNIKGDNEFSQELTREGGKRKSLVYVLKKMTVRCNGSMNQTKSLHIY
jgi:glutaredoxin